MNVILLENLQSQYLLKGDDNRTSHILKTLKIPVGGSLFLGVYNGPIFKATLANITPDGAILLIPREDTLQTPPKALPMTLILGLPRPQTARKILQQATSLGIEAFVFFQAQKGNPQYQESKLWITNEWKDHLKIGAEQAFSTYIPQVTHADSLEEALLIKGKEPSVTTLALDVYEGRESITRIKLPEDLKHLQLALGPEAGWSAKERITLRSHGCLLAHMGLRVLRQETASIAAAFHLASRLKWI